MEEEGYLSGSQVEKFIKSCGVKRPSVRFISLFFNKSPQSMHSLCSWYKPKESLTLPQIKEICERGNFAQKAKETLVAKKAGKKKKVNTIWREVTEFVNKELSAVNV